MAILIEIPGMVTVSSIDYKIPKNAQELPHKRMNVFEWLK
jgi:hypothetical protein